MKNSTLVILNENGIVENNLNRRLECEREIQELFGKDFQFILKMYHHIIKDNQEVDLHLYKVYNAKYNADYISAFYCNIDYKKALYSFATSYGTFLRTLYKKIVAIKEITNKYHIDKYEYKIDYLVDGKISISKGDIFIKIEELIYKIPRNMELNNENEVIQELKLQNKDIDFLIYDNEDKEKYNKHIEKIKERVKIEQVGEIRKV